LRFSPWEEEEEEEEEEEMQEEEMEEVHVHLVRDNLMGPNLLRAPSKIKRRNARKCLLLKGSLLLLRCRL
jgi:hypothetical protein